MSKEILNVVFKKRVRNETLAGDSQVMPIECLIQKIY